MADYLPQLQFGLGSIQIEPLEASQLSSKDMISKGYLGNLGMKGLTIGMLPVTLFTKSHNTTFFQCRYFLMLHIDSSHKPAVTAGAHFSRYFN